MPATGCLCWLYGADGACIVELRVNDMEEVMLGEGGFRGGMFVVSLRMNARVLSLLFESGCGGD